MNSKKGCLLVGGILVILAIFLLALILVFSNRSPSRAEPPIVRILYPLPNASLQSGVEAVVQAAAEGGQSPIRWMRFYVNDLLAGEQMGPDSQLIGTWKWTPAAPGLYTLAFVAVDEKGGQALEMLPVTVLPSPNRDGDELPDERDACPDQAGAAFNQGCAVANDADADGLADEQDACPQEAGLPEERGCLPWNRPDQDGDGAADWEDHCPAQAGQPEWNGCPQEGWFHDGDADGLVDAADPCPQQPGPFENNGCPLLGESDRDGDGVPDAQDSCPGQAGSPQNGGCPLSDDRDGDGVPDGQDQCPDTAGWREFNGCLPEGWNTDADSDGVMDFLDRCDSQPGPAENLGCPFPQDRDSDGVSDDQDNCPDSFGPARNQGCPERRLLPQVIENENLRPLLCRIFPASCDYDNDGVSDEEDLCPGESGAPAQGGCAACRSDSDCDGVLDGLDKCPSQFGIWRLAEPTLMGCPLDHNWNRQPDESDNDGDAIPNETDTCPDQVGPINNGGCPRPPGVSVDVIVDVKGFSTINVAYDNFYCYARLQGSGWMRLPERGSLERSSHAYYVEQQVPLTLSGDEPVRVEIFCEGQPDPLAPVQDLGRLERAFGPEFWHKGWLDFYSDTGGFVAEFRFCEEKCR